MDDPLKPFITYVFATDKNVNSGTFGVFKIDFTPSSLNYVYTPLSMSSGQYFSANSIARISLLNPNDFYFAGKARSLTDGTSTQTFPTAKGYLMMGKTSDTNLNSFSFVSGYSLSL